MKTPPAPTSSSPQNLGSPPSLAHFVWPLRPSRGNAGRLAEPDRRRSGLGVPALLSVLVAVVLSACSSAPPPADWQMGAKGSLERSTEAWLRGDSKIEAVEFARARAEVASTGRPDWVARVELVRCAARVASLEFEPCSGFEALANDAAAPELAYSRYLVGAIAASDVALLPRAHQSLAVTSGAGSDTVLAAVDDPLSRLVAAGVLMRRGEATPGTVQQAVDTASARGWRRPLLVWLRVAQERAKAGGAADEVVRLQRRIDVLAPTNTR